MGKRALIVDDSKSARLSLARILQKHAIEVDTAESAELAIEYLGTHRPDAIFMDHMMAGMDGLQAVQIIKNNPRTATIPIMMYTSQEGELYVGQARALGAIGVMPKQVKPADVTKVLYQLNLAADRRSNEQSSFRPVELVGAANDDQHHGSTYPSLYTEGTLREQLLELRRTVLSGFDGQGDRLLADMRAVLQEQHPRTAPGEPQAPRTAWLPWLLVAAMAGACAVLAVVFSAQGSRLAAVETQLAQLTVVPPGGQAPAEGVPAAPEVAAAAAPQAAPPPILKPIVQSVPYGTEPFSGTRLDAIRQLFDRLAAQGFQGNVDIRTYSGRFCLVGNATDGYSLAPDDLPYARCDTVSAAATDQPGSGVRIPVVLADLMGALRASSHDQIHVQVSGGDGTGSAGYPPLTDTLTAGEWNRAAGANNRIEIHVR
ncbi:MAG: response regulator [Steroidobacteraceae bacterium]